MGIPSKFDVVVVGAGPAGCSSAYLLSKAGLRVLVIERGRSAGSKLLWGGKAYAQPIREVWPELDGEAPIHRWVTKERFSFVWGDRILTLEYKLGRSVAFTSYLPELVSWMARKAESAGAILVEDVRVDEIVMENGRVVGVRSGSDVVKADIVIDAEGVNRILLEKLGLAGKLDVNSSIALGVKETLSLDPKLIEERFNLDGGEGLSWFVIGDITRGLPGGGFIYTMRDSISIGLVLPIGPAVKAAEQGILKEHISELIESFRLHPYFNKFWREADVIEYGGRITIEGGLSMAPKKLYAPGLLVVGDAAGFLVNTGYTIRGVDMAVYSGKLAAETIIEALSKGGFTEDNLKSYEDRIRKSYIYRELKSHSAIEDIMRDPFYFTKLTQILVGATSKLIEADYEEPTLIRSVMEASRDVGISFIKVFFKLAQVVRRL